MEILLNRPTVNCIGKLCDYYGNMISSIRVSDTRYVDIFVNYDINIQIAKSENGKDVKEFKIFAFNKSKRCDTITEAINVVNGLLMMSLIFNKMAKLDDISKQPTADISKYLANFDEMLNSLDMELSHSVPTNIYKDDSSDEHV